MSEVLQYLNIMIPGSLYKCPINLKMTGLQILIKVYLINRESQHNATFLSIE